MTFTLKTLSAYGFRPTWLQHTNSQNFFAFIVSVFCLQVLKVDGAYVAVKFPGTSSSANCQSTSGSDPDPSSLLQDCRLLRIDELQVCCVEQKGRETQPQKLVCFLCTMYLLTSNLCF